MYRDAVTHAYWTEEARKSAPEAVAMSQASRAEFAELLQKLEGELGQGDFFCGSVSIADLTATCHVPAARATGIDLGGMHGSRHGPPG